MQVLSKLSKEDDILKWNKYFENDVNLKKYKVRELKEIAKSNKLHISGTKPVLIERIINYFSKVKNVVKIQSIFRMYLVKMIIRMKGLALKNKTICVNDSDFYTLEPLNKINFFDFFSYCDDKNFTYGFDINSLMILFKKPGLVKNPYNRDQIPFNIIKNATIIAKINKYLFKKSKPIEIENNLYREAVIEKMRNIRNKEVNTRIEEVFYEIDSLGNYSSSSWFKDLTAELYMNLLKYLYDIWNYRANMPTTVKRKICPFFNPFLDGLENTNIRNRENIENIEVMKGICLTVIENIIYTGINNEYRQIGAMHVLSALTLVSPNARAGLPWLYESVDLN